MRQRRHDLAFIVSINCFAGTLIRETINRAVVLKSDTTGRRRLHVHGGQELGEG